MKPSKLVSFKYDIQFDFPIQSKTVFLAKKEEGKSVY